jgi:hypothetical protein
MENQREIVHLHIEHRIRRLFLIKLATQTAEWFYPFGIPPYKSIPDRLLTLGCRIARPEYRVNHGPWIPMGTMSHRFRDRGDVMEVEIHVQAPEE